jgi:hypothetical protein
MSSSPSPQKQTFIQRLTSRFLPILICAVVAYLMGGSFPPAVWFSVLSGNGTFSQFIFAILLAAAWILILWMLVSAVIALIRESSKGRSTHKNSSL